jgi:hypothetical protein
MSSIYHTSGVDTTDGGFVSKFEESPSCDNVGGVGGKNHTPRLINPLTKPISEIQILPPIHDETLTPIQIYLKNQNL